MGPALVGVAGVHESRSGSERILPAASHRARALPTRPAGRRRAACAREHDSGSLGRDTERRGIDWALENGFGGAKPTTLCALQVMIQPGAQGRGISRIVLEGMIGLAREHGLDGLIAPVRPTLKHLYPLTPVGTRSNARAERRASPFRGGGAARGSWPLGSRPPRRLRRGTRGAPAARGSTAPPARGAGRAPRGRAAPSS